MTRRALVVCAALLSAGAARADGPRVLKLATSAPDGTAWARQLKAAADGIAAGTNGTLKVKWYFGGIAGDEVETADRMAKGQLDGVASGGPLCERIAPTMKVLSMPGFFQSRDEAAYVVHVLRPILVDEAQKGGYALLITSGLGPVVVFSRKPIRSMAELRRTRLWTWDLNEVEIVAERAMGFDVVPGGLLTASKTYASGAVDGFFSVPAATLAFQWSTQARYFTDLRTSFLTACVVVANRVFDKLTREQQDVVREEFAKGDSRFEELGQRMDDELLGGLFAKQGMVPVPVSETFRSEFFDAARKAREKVGQLVPQPLVARVLQLLVDYRAQHETAGRK